MPGWTATTTKAAAGPAGHGRRRQRDHRGGLGRGVHAADAAAASRPGQFQEFALSGGPFPDADSLTFPVVQTYSDGSESAWIEPTVEGQAEPEHPAPVLVPHRGRGSGSAGRRPPTTAAPRARARRRRPARRRRAVPGDPRAGRGHRRRRPRVAGDADVPCPRELRRPQPPPAPALAALLAGRRAGADGLRRRPTAEGAATTTRPPPAPATVEGPDDIYAGLDLAEPYRRPSFTLTDTTRRGLRLQGRDGGPADAAVLRLHALPRRLPDDDGRHRGGPARARPGAGRAAAGGLRDDRPGARHPRGARRVPRPVRRRPAHPVHRADRRPGRRSTRRSCPPVSRWPRRTGGCTRRYCCCTDRTTRPTSPSTPATPPATSPPTCALVAGAA